MGSELAVLGDHVPGAHLLGNPRVPRHAAIAAAGRVEPELPLPPGAGDLQGYRGALRDAGDIDHVIRIEPRSIEQSSRRPRLFESALVGAGPLALLDLGDLRPAALGEEIQLGSVTGDRGRQQLHQPGERCHELDQLALAVAEIEQRELLDHLLAPGQHSRDDVGAAVGRTEHDQPSTFTTRDPRPEVRRLMDHQPRHQAAHRMRQNPNRPVRRVERLLHPRRQELGSLLDREPPVVGERMNLVGGSKESDQITVGALERLGRGDLGAHLQAGEAPPGNVAYVHPVAVTANGEAAAHDARQQKDQRAVLTDGP